MNPAKTKALESTQQVVHTTDCAMNSTTRMAIGFSAIDSYCEEYPQANSWMLLPAFILSFGLLIALHIKRKVRHRE
jgi:hypothetical protein